MTEPFELTVSKFIPAPVKSVFEAWLDPKALAQFIKPMEGMPDCTVEVDTREGGSFLTPCRFPQRRFPQQPPRRLDGGRRTTDTIRRLT